MSTANPKLPDELGYLITAFLPTQPSSDRSKAYVILTAFCQGARNAGNSEARPEDAEEATRNLAHAFKPIILDRLSDFTEESILVASSFLTALFQVDRLSAASIFLEDVAMEYIMDSVDLLSSSAALCLQVAHLLGQAAASKACRPAVSNQCSKWLQANLGSTSSSSLRAASAAALVKLTKGTTEDKANDPNAGPSIEVQEDEPLASLMKKIVMDGGTSVDAVEGLAYLSVNPTVKEDLANDSKFLSHLFALVPRKPRNQPQASQDSDSSLFYGVVVVAHNLCVYRPRLNEEDANLQKLRRMAKAGQASTDQDTSDLTLNDDEHCRSRARKLVSAGAIDALVAAILIVDSMGVRLTAGKALLSIIEDKANRGKVLQGGGSRALMTVIKASLAQLTSDKLKSKNAVLPGDDLLVIQALAKLAITSSPVQVFGPNDGVMYDAIRPFSIMLSHPAANLLQRFESMMALTNISSHTQQSSSRVAKAEGLMNKVEYLLLEENTLVRRAAMELICNLVSGSPDVFEKYALSQSKLQVLVALSDVEDLPTRLAASGAIAALTSEADGCKTLLQLQKDRQRVVPILTQLIDPSAGPPAESSQITPLEDVDPGLLHRGIVCVRNFLLSLENIVDRRGLIVDYEKAGLLKALAGIVQEQKMDIAILGPAVEVIQCVHDATKA